MAESSLKKFWPFQNTKRVFQSGCFIYYFEALPESMTLLSLVSA